MATVVVGLGSNLGDRMGFLRSGIEGLIRGGVVGTELSSVYETPPIGYLQQPNFLNMVLMGRTALDPESFFSLLRSVEDESGRERSFPNAPRTLDLDLVFFSGWIVRDAGLCVPHPRWKERSFVVRPLAEIAPDLRDPETGWSIRDVARFWPMEPSVIEVVEGTAAFRALLEEGVG